MALRFKLSLLATALAFIDATANTLFGAIPDSPPAPEPISNADVASFLSNAALLNPDDVANAAVFNLNSPAGVEIGSDAARFYTVINASVSGLVKLPNPDVLKVLVINASAPVTISFEALAEATVPLSVNIAAGGQAIYAGLTAGPAVGDDRYEGLK